MSVKKHINKGAEEFLSSLKPGTFPKVDEDDFLDYLIKDAIKYLNDENKLVYENYLLTGRIDPSEDYLSKMESSPKFMVFLSIDIVGSTSLSKSLNIKDYAKIMTLYQRAMGAICHNFNGYVLKYTGDGVVCFFPEPDVSGMCDNALYCAYSMKKYFIRYLNPLLLEKSFPELKFRIGVGSGEVIKTIVGYNKIKQHFDLLGYSINLASKIQSIPVTNSILLGQSTSPLLNNFWKDKLSEVDLTSHVSLIKITEKEDYKVYVLEVIV